MTLKSLSDAVLDAAVKNFALPSKPFSAYQITQVLRSDVNAGHYQITEFVQSHNAFGQEVPHSKVRDAVEALFKSGHFDRVHNGTYYVYSVGTVRKAVINSINEKDPIYIRLKDILANQTGADANSIAPTTSLMSGLGFDDLDCVEVTMAMELEFSKELGGRELDASLDQIKDVEQLYRFLVKEINTPTKSVTPVVKQAAPIPVVSKKCQLRMYIERRVAKGVTPSLKSAQKAISTGQSVREISESAKSLGYRVIGNQQIPFNQWVISK